MTVFPNMYVCYCVGPSWPSPRKQGATIPEVLLFLAKNQPNKMVLEGAAFVCKFCWWLFTWTVMSYKNKVFIDS